MVLIMDFAFSINILPYLDEFCKKHTKHSRKLSGFLSKQIWNPSDRQALLDILSELFLSPSCTVDLATSFSPIILEIAERAKVAISKKRDREKWHLEFCIALSKCIIYCPDMKRFTLEYLRSSPIFMLHSEMDYQPQKKKSKTEKVPDLCIIQAAWQFLQYLRDDGTGVVHLEPLLGFLAQDDKDVKWMSVQCVAKLLNMSPIQKFTFLSNYFTKKEQRQLSLRHYDLMMGQTEMSTPSNCCSAIETVKLTHTQQSLVEEDFSSTVMVEGILLPRFSDLIPTGNILVPVQSTRNHVRSLALAVASGNPILLQGPVGCGKTSLVEHIAHLVGRNKSPELIKIQLGDQTDSKALVGTYCSTDIPGEFIWRPGILTQAVIHGYWVLLEDVDFAPMDVVSVLLPLLENNVLCVPGHGDNIKASPDFCMFATQRLIEGRSGWHQQQTGGSLLLDKMWMKVNVEPLSKTELKQVICTRYPKMTTIVDKLLDVYFMLSSGQHELSRDNVMDEADDGMVGKFQSRDGRLISTRDLMNWCARIALDIDVSSTSTGNRVLQEAIDCFVASVPSPAKRILISEAIGSKFNITKVKTEYYCAKYKPEMKFSQNHFRIGRVVLSVKHPDVVSLTRCCSTFSFTRQSCSILEKVAVCVDRNEPVLLVGETGTGKTSSVQYLAERLGYCLRVINMNQHSDSTDLLGGFKPVDLRHIVKPLTEEFELLFSETFSRKQNSRFIGHLQECFNKRRWKNLFSLMDHTVTSAVEKFVQDDDKHKHWKRLEKRLNQLKVQVQQTENVLAFTFIEGTLVKALRNGDWVLLDEINLAAAETLECLGGLLESTTGSVLLTERGDNKPVTRHKNFRLFACMNPATDVGKKDLTPGIRNRFTELFVDELEEEHDLKILVSDYLKGLSLTAGQVDGIVKFYLQVRAKAIGHLTDGSGHKPHFSLRTLCRSLKYCSLNRCGQVPRSLYEGFCMSFLTQLDRSSHPIVQKMVGYHIVGKYNLKSLLKVSLPEPPGGKHLMFEGYWISVGSLEPCVPENYVLTPSVRINLRDLARVVAVGIHPVLLQGETSVGKTSLITWLSQSSGNVCVRINNHEHTDLQEYIGCYAADETGKLVFKEGVLVEAMRQGHWIILDELNLAPTDVLEALNRLLDDNRELFIPETQEMVKAHPKFMLFATQNPPGHYGGRKLLSRAFRNRFIELHFDEIPSTELETILQQRCNLPLSYAKRLVAVMLELQTRRKSSGVFAGKQGFMTLRDLFRWAERYIDTDVGKKVKFYDWDKHLADHGYMLLAGRVRKLEEADVVQKVIQKHFKCTLEPAELFTPDQSLTTRDLLNSVISQSPSDFHHIVWTYNMRRMAVLIGLAVRYKEPVLLIGDTGCGKTTVCQLYAAVHQQKLQTVNCHLHTESADFLGGLRPVRTHAHEQGDSDEKKLFEWCDGPLVEAMKNGSMFLVDEISLADDSVLERLNSVLEPERTLLLAEKGGGDGNQNDIELVQAQKGFQLFATMNPGGDFGKKELSPALRNRFTEIWCPQTNERHDLIDIIEHNLSVGIHLCNQEDGTSGIGNAIMDFVQWFSNNHIGKRCTVSIRDLLSWVKFINVTSCTLDDCKDSKIIRNLETPLAFIHGACLVFLDGLGSGLTNRGQDVEISLAKEAALKYLLQQISHMTHQSYELHSLGLLQTETDIGPDVIKDTVDDFSISPFSIKKGSAIVAGSLKYALKASTTCINAQRVLRALQLSRPLLLEGSPGVGKTSLVAAIARSSSNHLVRINLSEQTDVSDLFGADLPVEGAEGGVFAWRDGPFLQALKAGHWIILDELNLASQSVLEGLNACLDHRGEIVIPELGKTFQIKQKTRLFACQNPLNQGGGRKGLPKSFLNRFTQVFVEPLTEADLLYIASTMYPSIPVDILSNMVTFNMEIYKETMVLKLWGQKGSPWEFNLRDLFRWCDLILANQRADNVNPGEYVGLIYRDRLRSSEDKEQVGKLYQRVFLIDQPYYSCSYMFRVTANHVQVGYSFLPRGRQTSMRGTLRTDLQVLHHCIPPLESVMKCIQMNWMSILVGPQSCGKTSLIQLLSRLLGKNLDILSMNSAMDTTELLGGFEQSDLNHHVEQCTAEIRELLTEAQRELLLSRSTEAVATVVEMEHIWQECNIAQQSGKMSTADELNTTGEQVNALLHLLERLQYCQSKTGAPALALKENLLKLKKFVMSSGLGTKGGTFEWNDSLLVQALKRGSWLLIDNVNFCSPSVLDRLNALLEPDGELSISERGVIDGEIPTIKPHPQFRLFLSMDPRYGEISRAMRNRGVEIFINSQDECMPYEPLDVKVMLRNCGLTTKIACDWLIGLQDTLQSELPRRDRPALVELLQAATVAADQIDRGVNLNEALWHACNGVYVRSLKSVSSKQIAQELLAARYGHLKSVVSSYHTDLEIGVYPYALSSTTGICQDVELSNVKLHCNVFSYLVDQISHKCEEKILTNQTMKRDASMAVNAVQLIMEHTCKQNHELYSDWLWNILEKRKAGLDLWPDLATTYELPASQLIGQMARIWDSCMKFFFQHPLNKQMNKLLQETVDSAGKQLLKNSPWDLRWNEQLLDIVLTKHSSGEVCDRMKSLDRILNSLAVVSKLLLEEELYKPMLEQLKGKISNDGKFSKSVLHPSLQHLVQMFPVLEKKLVNIVAHMDLETYDKVAQVLNCLEWRKRLMKSTKKAAVDGTCKLNPADLILHWNWFYDKMVKILFHSTNSSMPQDLQSIVGHIHDQLGTDTCLAKQCAKFLKSWGHPAPYRSDREAECDIERNKLFQMVDVYQDSGELLMKPKVKVITAGTRILHELILVPDHINVEEIVYDQIEMKLQAVKSHLRSLGLRMNNDEPMEMDQPAEQMSENYIVTSFPVAHVQLWPLFEYVDVLVGLQLLLQHLKKPSEVEESRLKAFLEYCRMYTPMSPIYLSAFSQTKSKEDVDLFCQMMKSVLSRLWNCTATSRWESWLQWPQAVDSIERMAENGVQGPWCLHLSLLSHLVYSAIATADTRSSAQKSHPVSLTTTQKHLSVRGFGKQIEQLHHLSTLLWSHSTIFTNCDFQPQNLEIENFLWTCYRLLHSFKLLLEQEQREAFCSCLQHFQNFLLTKKPGSADLQGLRTILCIEEGVFLLHRTLLNNFLQSLEYVCETYNQTDHVTLGSAWVSTGLLQMALLAPKTTIDPVHKQTIKLEYVEQEAEELDCELEVRQLHHKMLTGRGVTDFPQDVQHPHVQYLLTHRQTLLDRRSKLEDKKAFRSNIHDFHCLQKDIHDYMATVGSDGHITRLLSKLVSTNQKLQEGNDSMVASSVLKEEALWQKVQKGFVEKLERNYPYHRDLSIPFCVGIQQVMHGMRLVCGAVSQKQQIALTLKNIGLKTSDSSILERTLLNIGRFPSITQECRSFLDVGLSCVSGETIRCVAELARHAGDDGGFAEKQLVTSLLQSSLMNIRNDCMIHGEITTKQGAALSEICNTFVEVWQEGEKRKQRKKEEQESLYKYKSTVHGDERSEEEREEREFVDSFPTFEKDFIDVAGPRGLESSDVDDQAKEYMEEDMIPDTMSDEDLYRVCDICVLLFNSLTRSDWLSPDAVPEVTVQDCLDPVLITQSVAAKIEKFSFGMLSQNVDPELLGGHLVASHFIQESVTPAAQNEILSPSYDIYHDANVSQVVQCRPVLDHLVKRVQELRTEWPDHPTLVQLVDIVERILSFSVTSPLIKFITGLELLLHRAQDWESNAAKFVSLSSQLAEISELVIQWRKLELGCWRNSLDAEMRRYQNLASKWWFYLYQLISAYISTATSLQAASNADSIKEKSDVLSAFKQFMESATLGDFQIRLNLVHAFHCQLTNMEHSEKQREILFMLWNVYKFYQQFLPVIQAEMQKLRVPIDKDLKGFVKITRWIDINYWALKLTTEKTHRTVHKYTKAFKTVLRQPVQGILQEMKEPRAETDKESVTVQFVERVKQCYESSASRTTDTKMWDVFGRFTGILEHSAPLLLRIPSLCSRMQKHISGVVNRARYGALIVTLDEFTGEVIEAMEDLQSLEVTPGDDKKKQRSEAKHINLRKRKALADLFKYLRLLGLSYKRGLAQDEDPDLSLKVPPLHIAVLTNLLKSSNSDAGSLDVWQGCDQYYFKCISRKAKFCAAIHSPSKDLGMGNIERCKGFTEHLMKLIITQYTDIARVSEDITNIRKFIDGLRELKSCDKLLPISQSQMKIRLSSLKDLLVEIQECLLLFLAVLQSAPRPSRESTPHPSPLPKSVLSQMALVNHGDELWNKCFTDTQTVLASAKQMQKQLDLIRKKVFWTGDDVKNVGELVIRLNQSALVLNAVSVKFDDPATNTGCILNRTVTNLAVTIQCYAEDYGAWSEELMGAEASSYSDSDFIVQRFTVKVESLVAAVLLVVQTLKKNQTENCDDTEGKDLQESDGTDLQEGHLVKCLLGSLAQCGTDLECRKVSKHLEEVVSSLTEMWEHDGCLSEVERSTLCGELAVGCLPILDQYLQVTELHLCHMIGLQRTAAKLLTVLFSVFTELATKGFCLPAEYSDEMQGDGATDFEDIEGGGMGEGEGVKDVSDQIETEDQLEDAQKPGEKKEVNQDDQPDIPDEEKGIEMSEDFDGKLQDLEPTEGEKSGSEDNDDDEEAELDRKMGDVDSKDADKLDEQLWGSDDEDTPEQEDGKEESGPGAGKHEQSEMVAKEDNKDKTEATDQSEKPEDGNEDDDEKKLPLDLEQFDETEYDEDKVDPYHGDKAPKPEEPEAMELPDDLNLDDAEPDTDKTETDMNDETTEQMSEVDNKSEGKKDEQMDIDEDDKIKETPAEEEADDQELDEVCNEGKAPQETGENEEGEGEQGFTPQDEPEVVEPQPSDEAEQADDTADAQTEAYGKTSTDAENVELSKTAKDQAGKSENDKDETDGTGTAMSDQKQGHQGQSSSTVTEGSGSQDQMPRFKRRPGHSDMDRTVGSTDQKFKKLKTIDNVSNSEENETSTENPKEAEMYEHIKDATSHHDAQALDVAAAEQLEVMPVPEMDMETEAEPMDAEDDIVLQENDDKEEQNVEKLTSKLSGKNEFDQGQDGIEKDNMEVGDDVNEKVEITGDLVSTATVERGPESSIHTEIEHLHLENEGLSLHLDQLRSELEDQLISWSQSQSSSPAAEAAAEDAWHRYEALTSSLSQELCEQLRLVLEPSQATKLKGDYRTGKRLNMRKVIPYIASQFRKDKIWLRRTKPSKRQYQIMLAIDDSSSMLDNHSKQMAFESLALISNALTLLEAGSLAICSFGETVRLLHPFSEQFTNLSGAHLLQFLTFEQKKTKIAQLLNQATSIMVDAQSKQQGTMGNPETSQLLLIVSDGRGLFMEGIETVKLAVRQAREANMFLVFVVLDSPQNKDSILDIKVPLFKGPNDLPEIKSYMDYFPFPFYIILKDINSLPHVLSDALRQWFELITAGDR